MLVLVEECWDDCDLLCDCVFFVIWFFIDLCLMVFCEWCEVVSLKLVVWFLCVFMGLFDVVYVLILSMLLCLEESLMFDWFIVVFR